MRQIASLPLYQGGSSEMIAKLVKAGYLRPERQRESDAITSAIAKMKEDLRTSGARRQPANTSVRKSAIPHSRLSPA